MRGPIIAVPSRRALQAESGLQGAAWWRTMRPSVQGRIHHDYLSNLA